MDKEEVDILRLQLFQKTPAAAQYILARVVLVPYLCRDENLFAFDAGLAYPGRDIAMVAVNIGGIDMRVAGGKRVRDRVRTRRAGKPPGPEPDHRYGSPAVEGY